MDESRFPHRATMKSAETSIEGNYPARTRPYRVLAADRTLRVWEDFSQSTRGFTVAPPTAASTLISALLLELDLLEPTDPPGEKRGVVHVMEPRGSGPPGDDLIERGRAIAGRRGGGLHALDRAPGGGEGPAADEMRAGAENAIDQRRLVGAGALLAVDLLVAA